jgi:chromosome segregation protein
MKLSKLELTGFRGFRDVATIPFASGFTVITGRNGSGKSSICDAIEYVINGQLSRFAPSDVEGGERIADYLWWRDGSDPSNRRIRALFQLDDGKTGERVVTPSGIKGDFKDELFYDSASHPPDPLSRLCQTALIRDESIVRLSTDIPEADRFELFYKAIGLSDLSALERRAHKLFDRLRESAKNLENEYRIRRERVAQLISEVSETRIMASKSSRLDLSGIQRRFAVLANVSPDLPVHQLTTAVQRVATEQRLRAQRLERLRVDLAQSETWTEQMATLENASKSLHGKIEAAQTSLKESGRLRDQSIERLRAAQARNQILASLAQLREHGARLGLQDGRCPLCGSTVPDSDFEAHLAEIQKNIDQHNQDLSLLSAEEASRTVDYSRSASELESLNREYRRTAAELETLEGNAHLLEDTARNLGVGLNTASIAAAIKDCQSKTNELEEGLAELEAFAAFGRVSEVDKQKVLAEVDVESMAKQIERLSAAAQNAKIAEDTARRVSWEAVDDCMAALSPLLSELYFRLKPHVDYSEVRYRMRGDVKRFLSFAVGNDINPRFTFSSGQRRALGLAFLLAVHLSRPWCKLTTLVLDDPVQHIDDYRALRFAEVLSSIRQMGHQVICTVEDPELADLLCRRLRSTSLGDAVRVELEYEPGTGARVKEVRTIAPLPERLLLSA